MILVSRNWASDSRLLEYVKIRITQLILTLSRESLQRVKFNKHPIWIVLYPEGTRKTSKKLLQVCDHCAVTTFAADRRSHRRSRGRRAWQSSSMCSIPEQRAL